jgi:hypothetical protein
MVPFMRIAIALTLLFAINASVADSEVYRLRMRNLSSEFVWVTMNCKHSGGGYVACEHFSLRSGQERTVAVFEVALIQIEMYPDHYQRQETCKASAFPKSTQQLSWEIHGPPCKIVPV